ncbi:MAG TPA: hypothetical protein VF584_25380 [Longimicrobium sp.]|jgi:hypothetical protein
MRSYTVAPLVLVVSGILSASASAQGYSAPLVQVDRSPSAREMGGPDSVTQISPAAHRFEDAVIVADVGVQSTAVALKIRNKSASTLRLMWDDASFIESDGEAGRIMHSGVRFLERDRPQPPSIIPAGTTLTDQAIPVDRVSFSSGASGSWRTAPIFRRGEAVAGKRVGLLIPVDMDGKKLEYTFWFQVVEDGPASEITKRRSNRTWYIILGLVVLGVIGNLLPDEEAAK